MTVTGQKSQHRRTRIFWWDLLWSNANFAHLTQPVNLAGRNDA